MREALYLFRKDVRHLWPRILFADFWIAATSFLDSIRPRHMDFGGLVPIPDLLSVVASFYLVVSVFHEEKTTGDNRYWLTRPFPRWAIFLANTVCVLLFLYIPAVAGNAVALAVNGLSPLQYLGPHAVQGLVGELTLVLAVAAMASIASGMAQVLWGALFWIAGWVVLMSIDPRHQELPDWPEIEPTRSTIDGAVVLVCAAAALWLMYRYRRRSVAAAIVALSAPLVFAARLSVPWHFAFEVKERSSDPAAASLVHISLDPNREPLRNGPQAFTFGEDVIGIYLPITLSGMQDGMQVTCNRVAVQVDSWTSSWQRTGQIVPSDSQLTDIYHQRISNGPAWLYANVAASAFQQVCKTPTHVRVKLAFTLYSKPNRVRIPQTQSSTFIRGEGFCAVLFRNSALSPSCLSVSDVPARADLLWRDSPGLPWEIRHDVMYPSGSFGSHVWETLGSNNYAVPSYPPELYLVIRRPIAWFERELDLPAVRLADYH